MGWLRDETGLHKTEANFVPLTPLSHLQRANKVFSDREALVYGTQRWSYRDYFTDATRLASALARAGIEPGDVVACLLPNTPPMMIAHFGIPAAGAVLNTINTRLETETIRYILAHGEAKLVLVDTAFIPALEAALADFDAPRPIIVEICDTQAGFSPTNRYTEWDVFLTQGDPKAEWKMPQEEWESLALNYTSGTTGRPKGVVYHHRGAYLMTMGTAMSWQMPMFAKFLTIVPLFHCNGWNHTWMMPALGGTVVACRDVTAANIYNAIADEGVQYFGGAPIVLNMIVQATPQDRRAFDHKVHVFTAGAPPAPATLAAIEDLGFDVMQVYGLTETYGHVTECIWSADWDGLPSDERAAIKARQGVPFPMMEYVTVVDETGGQIAMDGQSQGEIVMRGNCVMKGYLKDPTATAKEFEGGHFHSGDIAVQHENGYIQIADRAKDIIISGGENISSVEVEGALMHHPSVSLCAVVAKPDRKWGEVPCAFVELKEGKAGDSEEIISFLRARLAGFKTPKHVVFQELPKTATGKIQKFVLRQQAAQMPD